MLNAKKIPSTSKRVDQPALEAGGYPGRVVQVIGLGLQAQDPYKGEPKPPAHRLRVVYELADEFLIDEDGNEIKDKPRWVAEDFALHPFESDLANSTKRYLAIDPLQEHNGDWSKVVGMPCTIVLTATPGKGKNEGRTFNNVSTVTAMRSKEAAKLPELVNPGVVFDPDNPDMTVFFSQPDFITDRIKAGLEYEGSKLEALVKEGPPSTEEEKPEKETKKPAPKKEAEDTPEEEEDW